jgi:hypothetical protein
MAGDWIKVRASVWPDAKMHAVANSLSISVEAAFFHAFRTASWFATNGKYGKMKVPPPILDAYLGCEGFSAAMTAVGYLRYQNDTLTVHGFCQISSTRKSLGRALRAEILDRAACASCGTNDGLVVDHIIPIVRGGSCSRENLQALCDSCNRKKGRKTMDEFMALRESA